jgi:putative oxidoreductase
MCRATHCGGVDGDPTGYDGGMFGPRSLSRALLAAPFIVGGINALRAPAAMVPAAEDVGVPIAEQVGLPTDPELLVKINAGVQIGAGAMLVLGIWPRVASLALAASLVPTTIAGHRFWEAEGETKGEQMIHFAKNAGLLGGLVAIALDTGGRPSVFWQSKQAAGRTSDAIGSAAQSVAGAVSGAIQALPVGS